MQPGHDFWIKLNAFATIGIGLLYLAASLLIFWMSDKQSPTLLLLIVFAAGTFGSHCRYLWGALNAQTRRSLEWNMRSQFYPLVHLFCYASICTINFIKVLTNKYSIDIWANVIDHIDEPNNFLMLLLVAALVALAAMTVISTNAHHRSSYGYAKFVRDRDEFQRRHSAFSGENDYETGATIQLSVPPTAPGYDEDDDEDDEKRL